MKKLLKILGVLALLLLVIFSGLFGYFFLDIGRYPTSREEKAFVAKLEQWVDSGGSKAQLVLLTEFPWKIACAYAPYSAPSIVKWRADDRFWTIEFRTNDGKKLFFKIGRNIVDIVYENSGCFSDRVFVALFVKYLPSVGYFGSEKRKYINFHEPEKEPM